MPETRDLLSGGHIDGLHRAGHRGARRRGRPHDGLHLHEHIALPDALSHLDEAVRLDDAVERAFLGHTRRKRKRIDAESRDGNSGCHDILPV